MPNLKSQTNFKFKIKIGVLSGGPSNEREISLRSGAAVYKALIEEGLDACLIDVHDDIHDILKKNRIDVAFIALHGRFGEDGTVQKALEDAKIPYTGSGVEASRLALDKMASKKVFIDNGIPVPKYAVAEKDKFKLKDLKSINTPLVVKPQFEGSSIGLSVVKEESLLEEALERSFLYGAKALLEEYIDGRELTVGILDDKPLPVVEIVTREHVYDYKAKYEDPNTEYLVPAPIEKSLYRKAQELGAKAHAALGCRYFSRVDMMADKAGNLFVLEVNTIPGMTERSLLPKAAKAQGLSFNHLCVKLIENALSGQNITA